MLTNPYMLLGALAGAIVLAVGGFFYGQRVQRNADLAAQAEDASKTIAAVARAYADALEDERTTAARIAATSAAYQEQLKEQTDETNRYRADLRSGRLVMYASVRCPAGSGAAEGSPASASGRDGEARAELSGAVAEFLLGEADRCDAITRQLGACQRVILDDRELPYEESAPRGRELHDRRASDGQPQAGIFNVIASTGESK